MPEGFESGRDHDADMSSDGQFELEEKLDILSLHPSSSSGYGVLNVDNKESVDNDKRVCQVQSGQMDALASTPKAAAASRPIHQLQLETNKQTLSAIVERPLAPLSRPSNTHARATTLQPSISAYHISASCPRQLVRISDDSRPSMMTSSKMKSRRPAYTLHPPSPPITTRIFLPLINLFQRDPPPATNAERFARSVRPLAQRPSEVGIIWTKDSRSPIAEDRKGAEYTPRAPKRHRRARLEEGGEAGLKQTGL